MKQIFTCLSVFLFVTLFISSSFAQNILINGDLETDEPAFWSKLNGTTESTWASDTAAATFHSRRSFKIEKMAAGADAVGWRSENNADKLWNNAGTGAYALTFSAKTEGVNTEPADDDASIGALFTFKADGVVLDEELVTVDQGTASTNWAEYTGATVLATEPDEVVVDLIMGKDATGTVWFDNIGCNTVDGWSMGIFGGDAETPAGWTFWADGGKIGFAGVVDDEAHSGTHSVLLEETDDADDEMVFNGYPVAAKSDTWYKIGVWIKTEDVNTGDSLHATNITTTRDNNRLGITFFYHKGPDIENAWELLSPGDQFFYVDQTNDSTGWTHYNVISKSPDAEVGGVSMRARFTSFPMGKAWFDDFTIEELDIDPTNILINGDLETDEPAFWSKLNGETESTWASDTAAATFHSRRSFKIEKMAAGADAVGWRSENNADKLWNNAGTGAYALTFSAKTEGVNTEPADDDASIGALFTFKADGVILDEELVTLDQGTANTNWAEYTGATVLAAEPDEVVVDLIMGKDATGTVWFDNIGCNTVDGWSMGIFGGDAETPVGWTFWADGGKIGFAGVVDDEAHSGTHSVLLEETDEADDEMVFNGYPVAAESGEWYKIGVWIKTEDVNTNEAMHATNITTTRDNNRLGITFFYHKGPDIENAWELLSPGDQFFYVDQTNDSTGWTQYNVISQAPDAEVGGVSMRARFTSFPMGKAWYDDFSIEKANVVVTALETPQKSITLTPSDFKLKNNYPNPFNPETIIEYLVPKNGQVNLVIYNMLGQKVRTLVNKVQPAGTYQVYWNGRNEDGSALSSGVYFYQLQGENALITKKMILIK